MSGLNQLLQRYPRDCRPTLIELLGSAGGMSGAQFWRITAPRGTLILRRWPAEHPTSDHLHFIHAVVNHAAQRGITFLSAPITTRYGESFTAHAGHLWELEPWMLGAADYKDSPSIDKLRAAMTALAQFHLAVVDFVLPEIAPTPRVAGPPPAIPRRLARLHDLAHGGINALSRAITDTTWPDLVPLARKFIAALPRAVPRAIAQLEPLANVPLPLQPCLRDVWHDHVLFTGDEVTGLIDFGAIDIDTPATDIARLLGSLASGSPPHFGKGPGEGHPTSEPWHEGLAAYSAVRPLSQHESLAVVALDTAAPILAGCNWIRWIYIERRGFEKRSRVIERFRRIRDRVKG
ncbi:MAG: phosphotransferase [Planctomycetes bacterium]|nr:phosphotransferase [Planctomycetota bacterium]